jgi:hypothetical protein
MLWAAWGQVDEEVELEEINITKVPGPLDLETLEEYSVS